MFGTGFARLSISASVLLLSASGQRHEEQVHYYNVGEEGGMQVAGLMVVHSMVMAGLNQLKDHSFSVSESMEGVVEPCAPAEDALTDRNATDW